METKEVLTKLVLLSVLDTVMLNAHMISNSSMDLLTPKDGRMVLVNSVLAAQRWTFGKLTLFPKLILPIHVP